MTLPNARPAARPPLTLGSEDLHPPLLLSHEELLGLLACNAMAISRWKKTRSFPQAVGHGKYDARAVIKWAWKWKLEIEQEAEMPTEGRSKRNDELLDIKIERERLELEKDKGRLVSLADWIEADNARTQLAISILHTIPDRQISEGMLAEHHRGRALDLIGEAVDTIQQRQLEQCT
jgi:hypothetical protein